MVCLNSIKIQNYRSVKNCFFEISGNGLYIFTGKNGAGKSNLLNAISAFYIEDKSDIKYSDYNNIENTKGSSVYIEHSIDLSDCELKKGSSYEFNGNIVKFSDSLINIINKNINRVFKISELNEDDILDESIVFEELNSIIKNIVYDLYVEKSKRVYDFYLESERKNSEVSFSGTGIENYLYPVFRYLNDGIINFSYFWTEDDECLLKTKLNLSSSDILNNKYLLSIIPNQDKKFLERHLRNGSQRIMLKEKLENSLRELMKVYFKDTSFDVTVDISSDSIMSVNIKHNSMVINYNDLSSGLKKIFSIIFSQSISNGAGFDKNNIIIIDEPETHLHPSAIKDIRKIILDISKNNYVFIATHSPFMIDYEQDNGYNVHYYEVTNEENKGTKVRKLEDNESFNDDKLYEAAFGVNYISQLIASNILVLEGVSDVVVLKEAINDKSIKIIPGGGKKIKQLIESFKDVSIIGVFDGDNSGKQYKENTNNLSNCGYDVSGFIYKDFVLDLDEGSELEDLYDTKYVKEYLELLDYELALSCGDNKFKYSEGTVNGNIDNLLKCYNNSCLEEEKDKYQKLIDRFNIALGDRKPLKEVLDEIKKYLSNFFAGELKKTTSEYDLSKIKKVAKDIEEHFNKIQE